jgi:hypothetical protein
MADYFQFIIGQLSYCRSYVYTKWPKSLLTFEIFYVNAQLRQSIFKSVSQCYECAMNIKNLSSNYF